MEKVTVEMYQCQYCGRLFEKEESCARHEEPLCGINKMWAEGHTLKEINEKYQLIEALPEKIETATKSSVLKFLLNDYEPMFLTIAEFKSNCVHVRYLRKSTHFSERRVSYVIFEKSSVATDEELETLSSF